MWSIKEFYFSTSKVALIIMILTVLGLSTSVDAAAPRWTQVSTSFTTACGIQVDGTLWCWGIAGRWFGKSHGKSFDIGPTIYLPIQMNADTDWQSVSVTGSFADDQDRYFAAPGCALKTDGSRYCWGTDIYQGVLGMGGVARIDTNFAPKPANDNLTWLQISIGQDHSCGITTNNRLYCWGDNTNGQLGVAGLSRDDIQWSPRRVTGSSDWGFVSVGDYATCALKTNGARYCWGNNVDGQLGLGNTNERSAPVYIKNERKWTSISVGAEHTCGISEGNLYCWGRNYEGELGLGYKDTDPDNVHTRPEKSW